MSSPLQADGASSLLRHTLATLAYRARKPLLCVPAGFATYRPAVGTRSPGEILAHIGDLLDWALSIVDDKVEWHDSTPLSWGDEVARFYAAMQALDERLVSPPPGLPVDKIFQGPIADALTHIGQISMLRRMAGSAVRGESYFRADISAGKVGPEQPAPVREFD
ncbi:MAG: hypothetical protein ABI693_29500 [Bryobacteraceae bacterium]